MRGFMTQTLIKAPGAWAGVNRSAGAISALNHGGANTIGQAIAYAAAKIDTARLKPMSAEDARTGVQSRAMLRLLAGCYAREVYASSQIEQCVRSEPGFLSLFGRSVPNARSLRRFRRENREALTSCLYAALEFLAEQKVVEGLISRVNHVQIAEEASRRIVMAMFSDSMEMKDQTSDVPLDV